MKFSANYVEAREAFIQAVEESGFRANRFRIPHENSSDLFIDFALLRRDPKKLLLHICGTHGVEGYAGSAVQRSILAEKFSADGPSILFVHPLNPFGMAFFRRNNGENVDLNRNFILDRSKVKNPDYKYFNRYLNPKNKIDLILGLIEGWFYFKKMGLGKTSGVIAAGQAEYPGLFYVGDKLQREVFLLQDFLKSHFKDAEIIFGLDFHTGLGEFGQETLFIDEPKEPLGAKFFDSVFERSVDFEDASKGYYKNLGPLSDAIRAIYPKSRVHFVVQEFGTYPASKTLGALRLQNMYWNSQTEDKAADEMLENFCPNSEEWRERILDLGKKRFFQSLRVLEKC